MATVPWPKAIKLCSVIDLCFPYLYLYSPSCSLLNAQSQAVRTLVCHWHWQLFAKAKFWHWRVAPCAGTVTFGMVSKGEFPLPLVLILNENTNFTSCTPQCPLRLAGTRFRAQQLATPPSTYCGICRIPLLNFRKILAVV